MKDKFLTVVRYSIIISFLCWFISGATYHIFCKTEIKQKQDSMIHILINSNFAHQKHSSRLEKYGIVAKKTDSLCTFSQFF